MKINHKKMTSGLSEKLLISNLDHLTFAVVMCATLNFSCSSSSQKQTNLLQAIKLGIGSDEGMEGYDVGVQSSLSCTQAPRNATILVGKGITVVNLVQILHTVWPSLAQRWQLYSVSGAYMLQNWWCPFLMHM